MAQQQAPNHGQVITCVSCKKFSGCPHLIHITRGGNASFNTLAVITEEKQRDCPDYRAAHDVELQFRDDYFASVGFTEVTLEALFSKTTPVIDAARLYFEEDDDLDIPDFRAMLYDEHGNLRGLTLEQREEQLRYQTDEHGDVRLDKHNVKIPRVSLEIRHYVLSEEFASTAPQVDIQPATVAFWKTDQLVELVLKSELDQGLITRQQAEGGAPPMAKIATTTKEKKTAMPTPIKVNTPKAAAKVPAAATNGAAGKAVVGGKTTTKAGPAAKAVGGKKTTAGAPAKAKQAEEAVEASTGDQAGGLSAEATAYIDSKFEELTNVMLQAVTLGHDANMQRTNQLQLAVANGVYQVMAQHMDLEGEDAEANTATLTEIYNQVLDPVPRDDAGEPVLDGMNFLTGQGEKKSILAYLEEK